MSKKRLDQILVEKKLVASRNEAQSLIMRGSVLVDDTPILKAGTKFSDEIKFRIKGDRSKYVSRGGDKLEGAIVHFDISLAGKVVLDVGASTGGFTDCVLQFGASKVYATDVGHAQLAEKLRQDNRVVVSEKLHARDLSSLVFDPPPNFLVMDVSFISARKILLGVCEILQKPAELLILVKPQFELEPSDIESGGVVKDEKKQIQAVELVGKFLKETCGATVRSYVPSVLKGEKKGNQEYFLFAEL